MSSLVNNLTEYIGIANELPQLSIPACFKQAVIQDILILPEGKPDFNNIIKVMAEITVINTRVVKTSKGVSEEGNNLTGKKLIVEGEIRQKIEYAASALSQEVYAEYCISPFVEFIVMPEDFKLGTTVTAVGYIDDISVTYIDKRNLHKSISLLITLGY